MTGLELRKRLAAVADLTPAIFITAHDSPATRTEAEASGCAGYFRKTDPGDAILEAIRNVVGLKAIQSHFWRSSLRERRQQLKLLN